MAFDGNGNWISTFSAVADRDAGIKILASRFDNIFINDIAQSFENCLTKDGQVKTQVNFDVNNNRIINVVNPINDYDGANKAYVDYCIAHVEQDPLFAFKWADYIINDQSWLRADTFSWQDGTVYTNAYSHLVADIDGITPTTETVGSYTITYYPCTDGHKIVVANQETTVQNIYDESGVAWYYILDTANHRFKLPRTKFGFTGLRDNVGKYVRAGVPNITGTTWRIPTNATSVSDARGQFSGALYSASTMADRGINIANGKYSTTAGLDASRSSSIYGNSTTVQPPATQMYLYFYVGQFTQSATEQTAGLNSELFNGKVDLDSSWGFPKAQFDELTLGASGTEYTAPADGYVLLSKNAGITNAYIAIQGNVSITLHAPTAEKQCRGYIPVKRGDKFQVYYDATGTTNAFRFVYAQKTN